MHTDVLISRRPKRKQWKFKPNVIRVFTFNIHTYTHIYIHTYIYMQIFADDVDFQKQVLQLSVFLSVPWLQNFLWWPASVPSTYTTHYWLPANKPPAWNLDALELQTYMSRATSASMAYQQQSDFDGKFGNPVKGLCIMCFLFFRKTPSPFDKKRSPNCQMKHVSESCSSLFNFA